MATRSRTSFQKRQKEIARMEKQRDKAARRMQRKAQHAQQAENAEPEAEQLDEQIELAPADEAVQNAE